MPFQQRTFVIVDDNLSDAFLLKNAICERQEGANCTVVTSWTELSQVIKIQEDFVPDIFIIDFYLPKENGLMIVQLLRKMSQFTTTPICVFSGSFSPTLSDELRTVGATACILKPYAIKGFKSVAEQVLNIVSLHNSDLASSGSKS